MKCLLPLAIVLIGAAPLSAQSPAPSEANLLELPVPGQSTLRVLSPTVLELTYITAPAEGVIPPPLVVTGKNGDYRVTVDGNPAPIVTLGFKRRVVYAPLKRRDLRVGNYVTLELATPLATDRAQTVKVTNARAACGRRTRCSQP